MLRRMLVVLGVVACSSPTPPTDDTDDTVVDTDVDTDIDTDETDIGETGRWVRDTDGDSADSAVLVDSDTDLGTDTDGCRFGEAEDCNGLCFPSYLVGDGWCDDGDPLPADFDCDRWFQDGGDCDDTDAGPGDFCVYYLELDVRAWSGEIGWELRDASNNLLASVRPGTYQTDYRSYLHRVVLSDGTYKFVALDSFGDGWHGATVRLLDAVSGAVRWEGRDPGGSFSTYTHTFNAACGGVICDMDVVFHAGANPREAAWSVESKAFPVGSGTGAAVPPNGTSTTRIQVGDGLTYDLRMMDAQANGWEQGAYAEVRYAGGLLATASRVNTGTSLVKPFTVTCALEPVPAADAPGEPVELASCKDVRLITETGADGNQVGWVLWEFPNWRAVSTATAGSFASNGSNTRTVQLRTGRYFLETTDSGKDVWNGRWGIFEAGVAEPALQTAHIGGAQSGRYLDVVCAPPVDTDDTDEPVDTDDTDEPLACLGTAVADCSGTCWPRSYLGDGVCDDGTTFAPDFDCEALAFDDGDCTTSTP